MRIRAIVTASALLGSLTILGAAAPAASAGTGCPKGAWELFFYESTNPGLAVHDTNDDDQLCRKRVNGAGNGSATGSGSGFSYVDNVF